MEKMIITISLVLLSLTTFAQQDNYLAIELKGAVENEVNYPPGTEFFLFNENGDFILADGDLDQPFEITSEHTLIVAPQYKGSTDRFVIQKGRILMKRQKPTTGKIDSDFDANGKYRGTVKVRKEYFDAATEGERNVLLIFNNGLVFRYFDGNARAWWDGEEIEMHGKYLVRTPEGTAKISYNPKNGETWWVFDTSEKQ